MSYDDYTRMKPSEVRFIQDSISSYFQDGSDIHDSIRSIANGWLSPDNFPPIKVVQKNRKTYSFDNRRLYVFRVCEYRGHIWDVPVRIRPIWELREDKFTTLDDGRTVRVRRGQTVPHCRDEWFREQDTAGNWNLPAQLAPEDKNQDDIDIIDGRSLMDRNANNIKNTENATDHQTNVFSVSYSRNSTTTSSRSASRSNRLSVHGENIVTDTDYPPLPNTPIVDVNSTSTIYRPPSSAHSTRVYIAANIGVDDHNLVAYHTSASEGRASTASGRTSSKTASTASKEHSDQTMPDVVIVTEPQRNRVDPSSRSKVSVQRENFSNSGSKKSIFERVYEICCCCCAYKSGSDV